MAWSRLLGSVGVHVVLLLFLASVVSALIGSQQSCRTYEECPRHEYCAIQPNQVEGRCLGRDCYGDGDCPGDVKCEMSESVFVPERDAERGQCGAGNPGNPSPPRLPAECLSDADCQAQGARCVQGYGTCRPVNRQAIDSLERYCRQQDDCRYGEQCVESYVCRVDDSQQQPVPGNQQLACNPYGSCVPCRGDSQCNPYEYCSDQSGVTTGQCLGQDCYGDEDCEGGRCNGGARRPNTRGWCSAPTRAVSALQRPGPLQMVYPEYPYQSFYPQYRHALLDNNMQGDGNSLDPAPAKDEENKGEERELTPRDKRLRLYEVRREKRLEAFRKKEKERMDKWTKRENKHRLKALGL
ncbi:Hypp8984 [Branchiostoma lanceolatum]|uniref:Hypp8984 protein n=1 Tax=Branchiostoma lanceolatum TaxID=7740 RepID=A0A8K0EHC5_BRALA|nr:Hypp8984 [Branchiostoma lanceolatum]